MHVPLYLHPGESLITKYCQGTSSRICIESDNRMQSLCSHFGVTDERDFRYMFTKSIFSCITTLFSPSCPLSHREKREYVRAVIENPHVRSRCSDVFGGFSAKFLCAVIRGGSVSLNMAVFYFVALAGKLAPKLFMTLKHRK